MYKLSKNVKNAVIARKFTVVNILLGLDSIKFLALFDLRYSILVHWNMNITFYNGSRVVVWNS